MVNGDIVQIANCNQSNITFDTTALKPGKYISQTTDNSKVNSNNNSIPPSFRRKSKKVISLNSRETRNGEDYGSNAPSGLGLK